MYIEAVKILENYIIDLPEPGLKGKGYVFLQESYTRWAAEELLKDILENESVDPVIVVESFRKKVDRYSTMNTNTSYMFSVAYDVATNILDILLGIKKM